MDGRMNESIKGQRDGCLDEWTKCFHHWPGWMGKWRYDNVLAQQVHNFKGANTSTEQSDDCKALLHWPTLTPWTTSNWKRGSKENAARKTWPLHVVILSVILISEWLLIGLSRHKSIWFRAVMKIENEKFICREVNRQIANSYWTQSTFRMK